MTIKEREKQSLIKHRDELQSLLDSLVLGNTDGVICYACSVEIAGCLIMDSPIIEAVAKAVGETIEEINKSIEEL